MDDQPGTKPGMPVARSMEWGGGVRSIVSQWESSKEGWAQRGWWVAGSMGESPRVKRQGPLSGTTDWPRVMLAVGDGVGCAGWAEAAMTQRSRVPGARDLRFNASVLYAASPDA